MSIAIVGITVVDMIFPSVKRLPTWARHTEFARDNLVLLSRPPIVTLGGNGANAAYVAARCGADVTLHTQIARDVPGGIAREWLETAGCRIASTDTRAATAVNVTAADVWRRRASFFYAGARPVLPKLSASKPAPTHLLVSGWPHPPLAQIAALFRGARRRGTFTALDAGPLLDRPWTLTALRSVFASLDLFLANEYELRQIARASTLGDALEQFRAVFSGHIVVKRGREGATWIEANTTTKSAIPCPRTSAVNTIGAGDSFNGALLAALARGDAFPRALRFACAKAASVVQSRHGVLGVRPLT